MIHENSIQIFHSQIFLQLRQTRPSSSSSRTSHPSTTPYHYQNKKASSSQCRRHSCHTKESQLKQSKILTGFVRSHSRRFFFPSTSHSALIKISPRFFRLFYGHSFAILSLCARLFECSISLLQLIRHPPSCHYVPGREWKWQKEYKIPFVDDSSAVWFKLCVFILLSSLSFLSSSQLSGVSSVCVAESTLDFNIFNTYRPPPSHHPRDEIMDGMWRQRHKTTRYIQTISPSCTVRPERPFFHIISKASRASRSSFAFFFSALSLCVEKTQLTSRWVSLWIDFPSSAFFLLLIFRLLFRSSRELLGLHPVFSSLSLLCFCVPHTANLFCAMLCFQLFFFLPPPSASFAFITQRFETTIVVVHVYLYRAEPEKIRREFDEDFSGCVAVLLCWVVSGKISIFLFFCAIVLEVKSMTRHSVDTTTT